METILMAVAVGFAGGLVIQSVVLCVLVRKLLAKQSDREDLHLKERVKLNEVMVAQADIYQGKRAANDAFYREERAELNKRLADQEGYHQTERRELYERIQAAPVYTEPLLTGGGESGTDKGEAEVPNLEELSAEELAKMGIGANSSGEYVDVRSDSKPMYETVKDLLWFREEAEREKKAVADALK